MVVLCRLTTAIAQPVSPLQVVFKRQPHEFLPASPKEITGPYRNIDSLQVPSGMTNNNWVKFEGPVWENQFIAYRFYADTRHRFDIFGKKTPQLVLDTVGLDYHDVKNWGTDVLKVGESLGMGSPAFFIGDSAHAFTQWQEKTVVITEKTSEYIEIVTSFKGLLSPSGPIDLRQIIEFYPDSRWTKVILLVEAGNWEGWRFCAGIGKHEKAVLSTGNSKKIPKNDPRRMQWIGTNGPQSIHGHQLGMAVAASTQYAPRYHSDRLNHLLVLDANTTIVEYFLMAAWELDASKLNGRSDFKKLMAEQLKLAEQRVLLLPPIPVFED
jgi:Domain of unknown function (DUF4861)